MTTDLARGGFHTRWVWCTLLGVLVMGGPVRAEFVPPAEITVAMDPNYPPYLFTADDGRLQGIIKDKWAHWSEKTGVRARVVGVPWAEAQRAVLDGSYDVIDTLSYTQARTRLYEYSKPYAPVEARVYFHQSISGIGEVASLRGFTIGAKEGSACGTWLAARGINTISSYPNSETLLRAAGSGELRLFCMDSVPAQYYLFKLGLADQFRASPPLYTTRFHWAVKKGRTELREFIQSGFDRFTPQEFADIDAHWLGRAMGSVFAGAYLHYIIAFAVLVLVASVALIVWNRSLRARVTAKTSELKDALLSLDQAVSAGSIGLFDWDIAAGRVRYSREWKRQIGYAEHEISDQISEWHERVHPDDRERLLADLRRVLETSRPDYRAEFRFRHKDGSYRWILAQASLTLDAQCKPARMLGSHVDITENKRTEALLVGQKQVLALIASGALLEQSLDALLRCIEAQSPDMLCSILLLDADGKHVRHCSAPSLPKEYTRAIDGEPIGECAGSCGTAAFRREQVVVEDIETDPLWERYRDFTLQFGLRACWSTPIFDERQRVLGTFAMYFRTPRRPEPQHQQLIDVTTHTAAIAILKHREQQALTQNEKQLRRALDERTQLVHDLGQRVKELSLLQHIARLLQSGHAFDRKLLVQLVALMPEGWQYPEVCEAHIAYGGMDTHTPGWRETPWMLEASFVTSDARRGTIRVAYRETVPETANGPFLTEERSLIEAIADMLGAYVERDVAEAALRESEERLRLAVTGARLGTWRWDAETGEIRGSAATFELLGASPDAHISRERFLSILHPQDRDRANAALGEALKHGVAYELEFRVVLPDANERWLAARGQAYFDAAGWAARLEGIVFDITERKLAEARVNRLNRVYAMLSGINSVIVRVHALQELFDETCRLAVVAGKFRAAWIGTCQGETRQLRVIAARGEPADRLQEIVDLDATAGRSAIGRVVEEGRAVVSNDVENDPQTPSLRLAMRACGTWAFALLPLKVAGEVVGVLALHADETGFFDAAELELLHEVAGDVAFGFDHIHKEERINYLAYYDSLTGLANRTLFHERLSQFLHAAEREQEVLALCMIDLDHFKDVNDAFGRQTGDALLVQLAARMGACAGTPEQIARLGADRFAMVLPQVESDVELAAEIELKMQQCVSQPFLLTDAELRVAVKVGIAVYPADGGDAETLFRNAEAALKQAKANGERCLFYQQEMSERIGEKITLESKLRRAIENDEFVLYYQPKVDAARRHVTGVEALIRWVDPKTGLVPPSIFIPLLETTGMILDVGTWALRRAVEDHAYWTALGVAAPRVAVNVSAAQLRQRHFVEIVHEAAGRGAGPAGLELEVTESLIMTDIDENIGKLREIRDLGVGIVIDDFGTGYSSLSYLANLPAHALKIDVSFIARMLTDPGTMTLVSTMISLAHSLGLRVVAEGVETEEQAVALQQLGCDELQGYLIDRPLPHDRLVEFLRSWSAVGGDDTEATGRASGGQNG